MDRLRPSCSRSARRRRWTRSTGGSARRRQKPRTSPRSPTRWARPTAKADGRWPLDGYGPLRRRRVAARGAGLLPAAALEIATSARSSRSVTWSASMRSARASPRPTELAGLHQALPAARRRAGLGTAAGSPGSSSRSATGTPGPVSAATTSALTASCTGASRPWRVRCVARIGERSAAVFRLETMVCGKAPRHSEAELPNGRTRSASLLCQYALCLWQEPTASDVTF